MGPYLLLAAMLGVVPTGELVLKTGDLKVTMTSQAAWTMRTVEFQGQALTVPAGGQGAVLFDGDKWLGSAMSAEPTEPVASVKVTVDGKEATLAPPQELAGQKIVVSKESELGGLKHTAETTLEGDLILQRHQFTAAAAVAPKPLHAFIYSFDPKATLGLAQAADGALLRYAFKADNGHWPSQPVRWVAQFDPTTGKGLLALLVKPLTDQGGKLTLWDTKGYHKLFYEVLDRNLGAGAQLDTTLALQPFAASADQWEGKVQDLVADLRQRLNIADEPPTTPNRKYGEGVPETGVLTLQTAHYTVPFSAEQAWTIYEVAYDGKVFSGHNGYHGTVLIPQGGNFVGTGHQEGGAEIVHALKLTVDGVERPATVGETVTGKELVLRKESTIWKLRCVTEVTVREDQVVERTVLEATENCSLMLMYYFMHCFVPSTTKWLAELPKGELEEGPLGASDKFQLNKDTRWAAQYEPNWGASLLAYTPRVIAGPGSASMIWDLTRYHKYYLRSNQNRDLKSGEKLDYTVVLKYVPGEAGDWAATKAAAAALAKQYPPVE